MAEDFFRHKLVVFGLSLLACVLWGSAFPALKIGYELLGQGTPDYAGRLLFAGYRFLLAGGLLLLTLPLVFKEKIVLPKGDLGKLIVFGIFNTGLQYAFFYNGLANTTAVKGAILNSMGVFFAVLFAHLAYADDKLTWRKLLGVVLGLGGIVVANFDPTGLSLDFAWAGEGYVLIAVIIAAISSIYAKNFAGRIHPFVLTAYQMVSGALFLLVLGTVLGGTPVLSFTGAAGWLLIYLALVSALAFGLWYTVLKYNRIGEVSLYRFLIPVSGSLLSVLALPEETLSLKLVGALVLVSLGIIIVNYHQGAEEIKEELL